MLRLLALGLAICTFGFEAAHAQGSMLYSISYVEVGPVLAKVGATTLHAYRDAARKEAASLDIYERIDRPNQFVILGAWADQQAYDAHAKGDAAKKLNDKLATMTAAPTDTRFHQGLSVSPATAGKDPVFVVTHVDVIPPEKDNGANALEQLADASRRHSGNLQFDVWRQANRPNHFTLVEGWANRGSFDVHQMQKETREFRMKLAPMSGALYDERLYKVLK
jgi:quinol monooxygenase YgiN